MTAVMFRTLFAALALICGIATVTGAQAETLTINAPAPDFTTRTFDGKDLTLADFRGQVLIINLWATWCGPCKEELPLLNSYYLAAAARRYGLKIVAVTTEDSLPIKELKPLAAKVAFDMARNFHGDYRTLHAVPTNFVIDRSGILRYAKAGAFTLESLNAVVIPLLQETGPGNSPDPLQKTSMTLH